MNTPRRNLMLGTAGHVDHGKTALVKLLTGCNTDSLAEEQQRGLTIDLGFAPCRLADQRVVGIVDVPGHVDFIRNMVAGAHGIDLVIFVVAADDGIMPQTHEHLHILTLMGVQHGLVALTKIDRVDPARREAVQGDLRRTLASTFLHQAPICPVSNVTGEGYDAFFDALNGQVQDCPDRPTHGRFRLWIEDTFVIRGSGTVVTGIPVDGRVQPGDLLHVLPLTPTARVRRLQVYGEEAAEGRAGECVALNLPDLEAGLLRRGMVLSGDPVPPCAMAEAHIRVLPHIKTALPDYAEVHFHIGTVATLARVALLDQRALAPGQAGLAQLRWNEPLCLVPGERFVLRANLPASGQTGLTTIGGGRILDVCGTRLRRQRPWTLDRLRARHDALDDPRRWIEALLRESSSPVSAADLATRAAADCGSVQALLADLLSQGQACPAPDGTFLHAAAVGDAAEALRKAYVTFHERHPDRTGATPAELTFSPPLDPACLSLAQDRLLSTRILEQRGRVFALAAFRPRFADEAQAFSESVATAFQQARWTPPSTSALAEALHRPPQHIEQTVQALVDQGRLVRVEEGFVIHQETLCATQAIVVRLFRNRSSFTTMEFRDALGVSRKYAVPLLDLLDRLRWTVRSGNLRTPGREARQELDRTAPSA